MTELVYINDDEYAQARGFSSFNEMQEIQGGLAEIDDLTRDPSEYSDDEITQAYISGDMDTWAQLQGFDSYADYQKTLDGIDSDFSDVLDDGGLDGGGFDDDL